MSRKQLFIRFITVFGVILIATAAVSFVWSLLRHGSGVIHWNTSLRLAFILAVVLHAGKILRTGEGRT